MRILKQLSRKQNNEDDEEQIDDVGDVSCAKERQKPIDCGYGYKVLRR